MSLHVRSLSHSDATGRGSPDAGQMLTCPLTLDLQSHKYKKLLIIGHRLPSLLYLGIALDSGLIHPTGVNKRDLRTQGPSPKPWFFSFLHTSSTSGMSALLNHHDGGMTEFLEHQRGRWDDFNRTVSLLRIAVHTYSPGIQKLQEGRSP